MSDVAAFFDLDRTLIDANSGFLWAKHERERGHISWWQFARAAVWTGLYHLSLIDIEKAMNEAIGHYQGDPEAHIDRRTREWFHDEIDARLRPRARGAIDAHREWGHHLVILTNSTCFEASIAAETWGFDDWLANSFPTDEEGKLVGECAEPLCYGEGKVTHATRWADERGVDLERSYFYSDSLSDLPMLEAVGEPRVVTPDPRLRHTARKRGWPILDWDE